MMRLAILAIMYSGFAAAAAAAAAAACPDPASTAPYTLIDRDFQNRVTVERDGPIIVITHKMDGSFVRLEMYGGLLPNDLAGSRSSIIYSSDPESFFPLEIGNSIEMEISDTGSRTILSVLEPFETEIGDCHYEGLIVKLQKIGGLSYNIYYVPGLSYFLLYAQNIIREDGSAGLFPIIAYDDITDDPNEAIPR